MGNVDKRVSLQPLDFEEALKALAETGAPPEKPVAAEKKVDKKKRPSKK